MSFHHGEKILRSRRYLLQLLKACSTVRSLGATQRLHALAITVGNIPTQSIFLLNNIIYCYVSTGGLCDALKVFDRMPEKNGVSYNTLISAYSRCGELANAWNMFSEMRHSGYGLTQFTLSGLLSCPSMYPCQGFQLHALGMKSGLFHGNAFVGTALLGLFGRHGCLEEAYRIFEDIPQKSLVTWNSMLSLLATNDFVQDCLVLFRDLVRRRASLSECSFLGVLSGLAYEELLGSGMQIHGLLTKCGFESKVTVMNSLINMYVKCKSIFLAEKLFEQMLVRDVVSWNTMIDTLAKTGRHDKALEFFSNMSRMGLVPSQPTFVSVINSCTNMEVQGDGESVHAVVIKTAFVYDVFVGTAMVDFYAKCSRLECAHKCFNEIYEKNLVSWNALISGYAKVFSSTSILLFQKMLQLGYRPNEYSFSAVLNSSMALELYQLHCLAIRMGYENNDYVLSSLIMSYTQNSLLTEATIFLKTFENRLPLVPSNIIAGLYNRTGQYHETIKFLSLLQEPDIVSWNIVIEACARSNNHIEVFEIFKQMNLFNRQPDKFTFMSLLSVCTKLCNLTLGSTIHGLMIKTDFNQCDTFVCNVLIDMYGKCGSIESSVKVFDAMPDRNIITWTALFTALGLNGYAHEALEMFRKMELLGLQPDSVALMAVLKACKHGGLVKEGMELFDRMKSSYCVLPDLDHYQCIVDLLARNGYFKEAEKIIRSMPFPPNADIWRSFLEGYKISGTAS